MNSSSAPFVFNSAQGIYSKLSEKAVSYIRFGWFIVGCMLLLLVSNAYQLMSPQYALSQFSKTVFYALGGLQCIAFLLLNGFYQGPLSRMYLPKTGLGGAEPAEYDENLSGYYVFLGLYRKAGFLLPLIELLLAIGLAYSLLAQKESDLKQIHSDYVIGTFAIVSSLCTTLFWILKVSRAKKNLD